MNEQRGFSPNRYDNDPAQHPQSPMTEPVNEVETIRAFLARFINEGRDAEYEEVPGVLEARAALERLSASREPCTRVHVDPDSQHLLDLIDRLSAFRERYREALELITELETAKRAPAVLKVARQALTEGLEQ